MSQAHPILLSPLPHLPLHVRGNENPRHTSDPRQDRISEIIVSHTALQTCYFHDMAKYISSY